MHSGCGPIGDKMLLPFTFGFPFPYHRLRSTAAAATATAIPQIECWISLELIDTWY